MGAEAISIRPFDEAQAVGVACIKSGQVIIAGIPHQPAFDGRGLQIGRRSGTIGTVAIYAAATRQRNREKRRQAPHASRTSFPSSIRRKKHDRSPVWQAGPAASTFNHSAS